MAKRTPFYDFHVSMGGKMVDFAGWEMPISYKRGIIAEHKQCRESGSIFDVSHMGRIHRTGRPVPEFLVRVLTRRVSDQEVGQSRYSLICNACGQYSTLKSNIGVAEELRRLSAYLQEPSAPPPSCPAPECPHHGRSVGDHPEFYHRFGRSAAGARRYRCKACLRTFSVNGKPAAGQRLTHKNKAIFKELVNLTPFKRPCEVVEIAPQTLYRKIDFLHAQSLAFSAYRERQLAEMPLRRLYIACDRQEFTINWANTRDKRNVILKAIASVDMGTGYVFGMHTNFDPALDPRAVAEEALALDDAGKSMPFRRHARLWLREDHARLAEKRNHRNEPIKEGALLRDVAARYAEALERGDIEASDDPEPHTALPGRGMQGTRSTRSMGTSFSCDAFWGT
jgi:transposase-like protein